MAIGVKQDENNISWNYYIGVLQITHLLTIHQKNDAKYESILSVKTTGKLGADDVNFFLYENSKR